MKPKFEPRVLLLASLAVLALALVLVGVFTFVSHRGGEAGANATASVQENVTGSQAPVRCFVQGALAGEMSFQDCAARGGSAAQLEAKVEPVPPSAPLRDPADAAAIRADAAAEGAAPVREAPISGVARSGQCLRFAPDGWRGWGGGYRGGGGHGGGNGAGIAAGVIGGLLLGAIIANEAQRSRGANYCARRFRSYDPESGTYLGRDGLRHSCP